MHAREVAVVGVLVLAVIVPWLAVRDVWGHPPVAWRRAQRSRLAATALVVLVPVLGPALYLRRVRPALRR